MRGAQNMHGIGQIRDYINGGNEDLTRKKLTAERFLLIWYPRDPTYDQKKTPRDPTATNVFFWPVFKMAALAYSKKRKMVK